MKRWFIAGALCFGVVFSSVSLADTKSAEFQPAILIQFAVSDLDRSVEFYRDVVGLEMESRIDALKWVRFKTPIAGVTLGIGESEDVKGSGTTSINLGVSDVDAMRARLESLGVEFLGPTQHIPGVVRLADFLDPDGNKIRLAGHPGED